MNQSSTVDAAFEEAENSRLEARDAVMQSDFEDNEAFDYREESDGEEANLDLEAEFEPQVEDGIFSEPEQRAKAGGVVPYYEEDDWPSTLDEELAKVSCFLDEITLFERGYGYRVDGGLYQEGRELACLSDTIVCGTEFISAEDTGEPLIDCEDVLVQNSIFSAERPLACAVRTVVSSCDFDAATCGALCDSTRVVIQHSVFEGNDSLCNSERVHVHDTEIFACGFARDVSRIKLTSSRIEGRDACCNCTSLSAWDLNVAGDGAFRGLKDALICGSIINADDAFAYAKNVTLRDCVITGSRIGWRSSDLTLINCTIVGAAPLCRCRDLNVIDCRMLLADLAFEYSDVSAAVDGHINSVINPLSGTIIADTVGDVLLGNSRLPCSGLVYERVLRDEDRPPRKSSVPGASLGCEDEIRRSGKSSRQSQMETGGQDDYAQSNPESSQDDFMEKKVPDSSSPESLSDMPEGKTSFRKPRKSARSSQIKQFVSSDAIGEEFSDTVSVDPIAYNKSSSRLDEVNQSLDNSDTSSGADRSSDLEDGIAVNEADSSVNSEQVNWNGQEQTQVQEQAYSPEIQPAVKSEDKNVVKDDTDDSAMVGTINNLHSSVGRNRKTRPVSAPKYKVNSETEAEDAKESGSNGSVTYENGETANDDSTAVSPSQVYTGDKKCKGFKNTRVVRPPVIAPVDDALEGLHEGEPIVLSPLDFKSNSQIEVEVLTFGVGEEIYGGDDNLENHGDEQDADEAKAVLTTDPEEKSEQARSPYRDNGNRRGTKRNSVNGRRQGGNSQGSYNKKFAGEGQPLSSETSMEDYLATSYYATGYTQGSGEQDLGGYNGNGINPNGRNRSRGPRAQDGRANSHQDSRKGGKRRPPRIRGEQE